VILRPISLVLLAAPGADRALPLSPDPDAAAESALAALREDLLDESIPFAEWVVVRGPGEDEKGLAEAVAGVRAALAGVGIPSREAGRADAAESDGVGASVEVSYLRSAENEAIVLRALRPSTAAVLAPFVRKPWVRRLPDGRAGDLRVRGESGVEFEEEEARAGAIRSATRELQGTLAGPVVPAEALARILPEGEVARRFVVDTFLRREERGFGDAYRAFALVVVPADEVGGILARAEAAEAKADRARRGKLAALAGVGLVLFLGYVAADFATRGAFTNPLRLAALLAGVLAGGLLL